jgi:nicotinamidase-related amidase
LIESFRSHDIPVVWVNWGVRKDLLNISPSLRHAHNPRGNEPGIAQPVPGTRSEVIKAGSWGAQVVDEINPGDKDVQIIKHRFSAFWDTETDAVLRNMGIKTLFICGVNMDQCVMTTLEDASFLGYDTILIEDGTATTSPEFCVQSVLYNVKLLFGFVTRSSAILEALA